MKVNLVGISPFSLKSAPLHSHSDWEIVLNMEGEGTTIIGNCEYDFSPGSIICQPPNIPHSKMSESNFKDIFIQVSDFLISSNIDVPIYMDDEEKSFEILMYLALRVYHKKEKNCVPILNSLYETMQQLLLSWSDTKPKNETIELFKNELINNFMNPEFELSNAMKKTSYCDDHFRRYFKKETGNTPISYLNNLRIEYAKELLNQKSNMRMTISEISFLSGFYDPHYFSRVFKNKVGISPQNYILEQETNETVHDLHSGNRASEL
jgi:AraC-like DNA-binding protein